jgi:hypothetical protein
VTRRQLTIALAVLAAVTIVRIVVVERLGDQGYFAKYLVFADRILAGDVPRDRLADLSPGYLWLIVALRALGLGVRAIRIVQIVVVSIAAALVGDAARRLAGRLAGIAAALLLLGSKAALVCATDFEPETLILLLNAAALALLVAERRVVAGFFAGLSAVCRPVALLALPAFWRRGRVVAVTAVALVPVVVMMAVNLRLTGEAVLMDPGTVFYEGMNPSATGYSGVQPKIVTDLQRAAREPDYLHVAYRVVASKAVGHPVTRAESNGYWTAKALAFARTYPSAAVSLTARKALYALQSYDPWDLLTMQRKARLMPWLLFIPFGVVVALAAAAVIFRGRELLPLIVFAAAVGVTLIVFYVTARQRNALLPAMAILAGVGVVELRTRRIAALACVAVALLLSIPTHAQREDEPERYTDALQQAIDLERSGNWSGADALLRTLDFQPLRGTHAVSSLAYYRALAAAHLRGDPRPLLDRAADEAPGNEHVLAARAVLLQDARARELLFELHDPFTARAAVWEAEKALVKGAPAR